MNSEIIEMSKMFNVLDGKVGELTEIVETSQ